ncbi:helix-turn-helix domain-containing protein [Desulfofundulus sp. TPOSR]|uniref:helix-turn-helix domain-containing protein n=1 Tax=Desulfofundulus sp. TPOSR TaxID=2714340 RepID=UPI0028BE8CB6|nr:helix-turn-helix domain-containing protein [Desulfofundulus sp. TPOSR]
MPTEILHGQLDQGKVYTRREIARICHMSHTTLYKFLERYEEQGETGLYDKERVPGIRPNQTPPDIEEAILAFVQEHPAYGPKRISAELRKPENGGIIVGETAVYGVLKRNGLNTRQKRFKWVDSLQPPQEKTAWELDKEASQHRHVHAPVPGYLLSRDGKLIGRLAGIGKVYVQHYYNWERPHQGRRTRGRTPAQAFFVPYPDQLCLPAPKDAA